MTVLFFSGGWKSSCLWFHEDVALGFSIVGTESSRCLALNLIRFALCSPWAAPRQWLCMAKTLSRPIPETPLIVTLGSEPAPWLCPTSLELHGYLGNVHPHLLPYFCLSFTQSQTCTMVRGLAQPFLRPYMLPLIHFLHVSSCLDACFLQDPNNTLAHRRYLINLFRK